MTTNSMNPIEGMKALQGALGSEDLAKQIYADASAADRQERRNHFEGRLEFAKQKATAAAAAEASFKEYGLQTLKWLFLLNAGAIVAVLAYIAGKYPSTKQATSVLWAIWPFVAGCIGVTAAGGISFFNFSYLAGTHPTQESLNNFLNSTETEWPAGHMQKSGETRADFFRRQQKVINGTRSAAIVVALAAAIFFVIGVALVGRAATQPAPAESPTAAAAPQP
ncbi:anti-sigma-K factor RskA [Bradyrhizobium sp. S3.9.2]|uniref:hypothetical protein n=1 Tax=Bradyrhizobium sp. S3.9.2 TaxID=3156432 RepID=UPI0033946F99